MPPRRSVMRVGSTSGPTRSYASNVVSAVTSPSSGWVAADAIVTGRRVGGIDRHGFDEAVGRRDLGAFEAGLRRKRPDDRAVAHRRPDEAERMMQEQRRAGWP